MQFQNRFRLLPLTLLAILGLALPGAARAFDFGLRGGVYLEDSDPFVGAELLFEIGSSSWFFNPNIEAAFSDERDRFSGNFDFHYDFIKERDYYIWAGAGLALIHNDFDEGRPRDEDEDDDEIGANFLAGIGWRLPNLTPYAQLKVVAADDAEVVAAVGVRF
jgi:hypothetical protein